MSLTVHYLLDNLSIYIKFLFPYPAIQSNRHLVKQVGFKMFLGVTASVTNWDSEGTSCSLILEDNPLVDFVELPDTCQGLYYCNILSGVVRGALEMVRYACYFEPFPHVSFILLSIFFVIGEIDLGKDNKHLFEYKNAFILSHTPTKIGGTITMKIKQDW